LNENYSAAVFALGAMCLAVKSLFGFIVEFRGGLVSDHSQAFVNAFGKMFPKYPKGQCYPHMVMKFKDQRGKRKRGTSGYLKHARRTTSLRVGEIDVKKMHKCRMQAMKEK
jgi:hypothetical protein